MQGFGAAMGDVVKNFFIGMMIILGIFVPLGIWKFVEICIWICIWIHKHVHIGIA